VRNFQYNNASQDPDVNFLPSGRRSETNEKYGLGLPEKIVEMLGAILFYLFVMFVFAIW
jgi:hypothetical protein